MHIQFLSALSTIVYPCNFLTHTVQNFCFKTSDNIDHSSSVIYVVYQ